MRRDWRRAAQMYDAASKAGAGGGAQGQALFNLGFMHQYGAGLPKDHHLAKRCYDRCVWASFKASSRVLCLCVWSEGLKAG